MGEFCWLSWGISPNLKNTSKSPRSDPTLGRLSCTTRRCHLRPKEHANHLLALLSPPTLLQLMQLINDDLFCSSSCVLLHSFAVQQTTHASLLLLLLQHHHLLLRSFSAACQSICQFCLPCFSSSSFSSLFLLSTKVRPVFCALFVPLPTLASDSFSLASSFFVLIQSC